MTVRLFIHDQDYETLVQWWAAHDAAIIPKEWLPKLGVIISDEGIDVAYLSLYMDNSVGRCFIEHAVSNPKNDYPTSKRAFREGIRFLWKEAAALDYGVMTCVTIPAIARMLEDMGFVTLDKCLVSMSCIIPKE